MTLSPSSSNPLQPSKLNIANLLNKDAHHDGPEPMDYIAESAAICRPPPQSSAPLPHRPCSIRTHWSSLDSDLTREFDAKVGKLQINDQHPLPSLQSDSHPSLNNPMLTPPSDTLQANVRSSLPRFPSHFEQFSSASPVSVHPPQESPSGFPIRDPPLHSTSMHPSTTDRFPSLHSPPLPAQPIPSRHPPNLPRNDEPCPLPPQFPTHMNMSNSRRAQEYDGPIGERTEPNRRTSEPSLGEYSPHPSAESHSAYSQPNPQVALMLKAKRKRANAEQLKVLNQVFQTTFFPSTELRIQLGKQLGMSPRTVQIWFQNRRQAWRTKAKHEKSESSHHNPTPSNNSNSIANHNPNHDEEMDDQAGWSSRSLHRQPSYESLNSLAAISTRSAPAASYHHHPHHQNANSLPQPSSLLQSPSDSLYSQPPPLPTPLTSYPMPSQATDKPEPSLSRQVPIGPSHRSLSMLTSEPPPPPNHPLLHSPPPGFPPAHHPHRPATTLSTTSPPSYDQRYAHADSSYAGPGKMLARLPPLVRNHDGNFSS
ncbi:uncharacterized protein VTP21DRAFT_6465 [Calcarisporiella thermophila]|uniref:uncharacterized protein n=1 Tax=Calcarisporiella thermophila TaxID=911321 RepID=UPI0037422DF5